MKTFNRSLMGILVTILWAAAGYSVEVSTMVEQFQFGADQDASRKKLIGYMSEAKPIENIVAVAEAFRKSEEGKAAAMFNQIRAKLSAWSATGEEMRKMRLNPNGYVVQLILVGAPTENWSYSKGDTDHEVAAKTKVKAGAEYRINKVQLGSLLRGISLLQGSTDDPGEKYRDFNDKQIAKVTDIAESSARIVLLNWKPENSPTPSGGGQKAPSKPKTGNAQ